MMWDSDQAALKVLVSTRITQYRGQSKPRLWYRPANTHVDCMIDPSGRVLLNGCFATHRLFSGDPFARNSQWFLSPLKCGIFVFFILLNVG